MDILPFQQHIASAFYNTCGPQGATTEEARCRGSCRQAIYRQSAKLQQLVVQPTWPAKLEAAEKRVAELQEHVTRLQRRLADAIVLDEDKQAEVASVGQAVGVSLPTVRILLEVLLKERTPRVSKLGRWTKEAGPRAGALLPVFDEVTQPNVVDAVIDEIYTKSPVLMRVEPDSPCWVTGRMSEEVTGEVWQQELCRLPNLEMGTRDAGSGLTRGLKLPSAERLEHTQPPVAEPRDHFHSLRDGGRGLGRAARAAKNAFTKAEQARKEMTARRRQGRSTQGIATRVALLWRKAERAMDVWSEREQKWHKAKEALRLVTTEGELNTRQRATPELTEALSSVPENDFGKSQRLLKQKETLTHLDRVHQKWEALEAPAEVKAAAVKQECLRRRPELWRGETTQAAALRGLLLLCTVVLAKSGAVGQTTAHAVGRIFRRSWRASRLVECVNSVVRMHQARHRKMTQGLLDLKRLHWNCHSFRTGCGRGQSPYERLGISLPPGVT